MRDPAQEHHDKDEALAMLLGIGDLLRILTVTRERVQAAIAAGDEHLNTIPLAAWDRMALGDSVTDDGRCPHCGGTGRRQTTPLSREHWPYDRLRHTARREPWKRAPHLSLAERVCVLKHVAKYHTDHKETTA